ncbi:unnamed protein product [Urochloa humidicola]
MEGGSEDQVQEACAYDWHEGLWMDGMEHGYNSSSYVVRNRKDQPYRSQRMKMNTHGSARRAQGAQEDGMRAVLHASKHGNG